MQAILGSLLRELGSRGRDMDGFANSLKEDSPTFAESWRIGCGGEEGERKQDGSQVFGLNSGVGGAVSY